MIVHRARLRLTVGFAVAQLGTFALFALGVYGFVTSAFDIDGTDEAGSAATAEAGFATLRAALVIAFGVLLLVAPATSWLLAGAAMRPVAATLAAQRRFVDDASHELRTPLTVIQGQLELVLSRSRSEQEYREACAAALGAARALGAIADDLIIAADDDERPERAQVEMGDAVRRVQGLLSDPGRVVIEQSHPALVDASATAVDRILLNLLVNAQRYSDAGTPIRVRIGATRRWGEIEIRDEGKGMTRVQVRRAFERFWQADASRAGEGSGLGLSIVREIVTSLGGRIRLASSPGVGTTATVRLPLSRSSHGALRSVGSTEVSS